MFEGMENFKLVLTEHLNHYGKLFGGTLLSWVDESAYIAACMEFPQCSFVTVAMSSVEFRRQVDAGSVLRFDVQRQRTGRTSATYEVVVTTINDTEGVSPVFTTMVTFVNVSDSGEKVHIPENPC